MKFLSKKKVSEIVGVSTTEIDRKEAAGKFPRRVHNGFRVFWVDEEIDAYLRALIELRDHTPPRVRETEDDWLGADATEG